MDAINEGCIKIPVVFMDFLPNQILVYKQYYSGKILFE